MPIKIEKAQFDKKITQVSNDTLLDVYSEIYDIINVNALEKMAKKSRQKHEV